MAIVQLDIRPDKVVVKGKAHKPKVVIVGRYTTSEQLVGYPKLKSAWKKEEDGE